MSNLPRLIINLKKLVHNFQTIRQHCQSAGIKLNVVVKGLAGDRQIVAHLRAAGMDELGDSRWENLLEFSKYPGLTKLLLRLPSLSTAATTVEFADASLNAELATLKALDYYARGKARRHQVFLMVDQGDLREGVMEADLPALAAGCRNLNHLEVIGVGVNFSCFAGAQPTSAALTRLVELAEELRSEFDLPVQYVSGGNSSSLPLLYDRSLPPGVNHLRIGEAILLGRETLHGTILPDLFSDAFCVEAEILQVQWKPGKPYGPVGRDAFGRIPDFSELDAGVRLLINLGEQDSPAAGLRPLEPGVKVLGGNSDYLVLAGEGRFQVGQTIRFLPDYRSLLALMSSRYVVKEYREF